MLTEELVEKLKLERIVVRLSKSRNFARNLRARSLIRVQKWAFWINIEVEIRRKGRFTITEPFTTRPIIAEYMM